jgi:DedD protein
MARAISDEELQLKRRARRRLIGAIVLVTVIIVVLPMVLDSEPKPPGQAVKVDIPSPDSGRFTSKVVPVAPGPESKSAKAPEPKAEAQPPAEEKKAPAPEPAKPALKAETELAQKPPPPARPPEKKAKPAAPKPAAGRYVVQVIALADAGKAKELQEKIAAAGIKSYTEVVKTAKGDVTRVRVGPFTTREQAEKAREQLKALGMSGNIATK